MRKSNSAVAVLLAGGLLMAGSVAFAQPEQAPPGTDPAAMQEMMAKMMPGEQHQKLAEMAGTWKTQQKMWMNPDMPPMESEGTCVYTAILGGRYVQGSYRGIVMGQPFEGFSIDGYDNYKGEYFSLWLDSMGTGYYISHGRASADGKTLTHEGKMFDPMAGSESPTRSVTQFVDKNTVKMTMYQLAGGQETKMMEITYTRQ